MAKSKNQNVIQFPSIADIPNAPDAAVIYQKAGVIPGCGPDFFWFRSTQKILNEKQRNASLAILSASTKPKDSQRSWEYVFPFYLSYEIVTLEKFLRDFDVYSAKTLEPKTEHERALISIGFPNSDADKNKTLVAERHKDLVGRIRQTTAENSPFIHHGHEYIEDVSYGETRFHFAFLIIPKLFSWLVNESEIDATWIPYQIMKWVRDNGLKAAPIITRTTNPLNILSGDSEDRPKKEGKKGRPPRSAETKKKENDLCARWKQFNESGAGDMKVFVDDLNAKGHNYTVKSFRQLIDRCKSNP